MVNPVYLCPVCNMPFRRWRNAVRHFKVLSAHVSTADLHGALSLTGLAPAARHKQATLHWNVPEKGQRALQRMRRKSKIVK